MLTVLICVVFFLIFRKRDCVNAIFSFPLCVFVLLLVLLLLLICTAFFSCILFMKGQEGILTTFGCEVPVQSEFKTKNSSVKS